ncbi:MAG: hypothetical protein H0V11_06135 [Actinobacteria bacterium]|nr:hypothetical protein [Actinomycetota bacterium]
MKALARRVLPLVLAGLALVAALASAYVAREASQVGSEIRRSDASFRAEPAREGLWEVKVDAPGLEQTLRTNDDLAFRTASRLYELLRRRGRNPYDFSARAFRADAQLALARAEEAGMATRTRSKAANLEAIMILEEALGDPLNGPALLDRSLNAWRKALRIDAANEEAMFNLELVLRLLEPNAARLQIRYGVNARGRGVAGAAPLRRGHGY